MWKPWRKHERDLSAELESHLDMHTADNMRAGMSAESAPTCAHRVGRVEQTKERYRISASGVLFEELARDVTFAVRMLMRGQRVHDRCSGRARHSLA